MTRFARLKMICLLALPASAVAHEGHGTLASGWAHYLLEPAHGIGAAVVLLAIAGCWRWLQQRRQR